MPINKELMRQDDEKEHIIVIKDDTIFNYEDVIDKVMHRKEPIIDTLLRRKEFTKGIYRIRNGFTKRITDDEIEIYESEPIMWIKMNDQQAQSILGTDKPPIYGSYLRDLRKYYSKHEMSFMNLPIMIAHKVKPMPKNVQQTLV